MSDPADGYTHVLVIEEPVISAVEIVDGVVQVREISDPEVVVVGVVGPQGPRGPAGSGGGGSGTAVEDPHMELLVATSLGPGGNEDLTADPITTGKDGRLVGVDVGSSVPLRIDIQIVNGARVTRVTLYTLGGETNEWRAPDPIFFNKLGDGTAAYGVSITNLSVFQQADARATIYWDEVEP